VARQLIDQMKAHLLHVREAARDNEFIDIAEAGFEDDAEVVNAALERITQAGREGRGSGPRTT